jgi:hypothetical protein
MNTFVKRWGVLLLAGVLAAGCGRSGEPPRPEGDNGEAGAGEKYLLPEEPSGAKGVTQARKEARDGDEVVVVGRIGGDAKPWIEGRAGFWIVDPAVKSCKETEDDACPTPWDYCCIPKDELVKAMATVKVVDDQGQTIKEDARKLLGLKELQTVVVRGKAKRDAEGNLTVLADGIYRRPDTGKK